MELTTKKTGISMCVYKPNLVAMQFGLSQLFPKPLVLELQGLFISRDDSREETLVVYVEFFLDKPFYLPSFKYFHSLMKEFED